MPDFGVTLADIENARSRIKCQIRPTPIVRSPSLSKQAGVPISLKLEHHQITGSFKLRGATNAVLSLSQEQRRRGIVCVSTGNHGRGLAHASFAAGAKCIICMSNLVPTNKVEAIKALGADVRIIGQSQDEAEVEVSRLVAEHGMIMLPPFDHRNVIAGQGTLGLDILDTAPDTETLLVPLSGGGLIAGVALAAKARKPDIRIIGVSMQRGAAMIESLKKGKPVLVEEFPSLADSLGGGIGLENQYTFAMAQELVDETIQLTEQEIAAAVHHAYWNEQQIIEGSGSVGIGAVIAEKCQLSGPTVIILSGGNIDMALHHQVVSGTWPDQA